MYIEKGRESMDGKEGKEEKGKEEEGRKGGRERQINRDKKN